MLLLLPAIKAHAQHLTFRLFDGEKGLFDTSVRSLAQDKAGFIYAATDNGLFRYDGQGFHRVGAELGLPETGAVEGVRAAEDGSVWVVFNDRVFHVGGGETLSAALEPRIDDDQVTRLAALGSDLLLIRNNTLLRISRGHAGRIVITPLIDRTALAHDPRWADLGGQLDTVHVAGREIWLDCGGGVCRLLPDRLQRFGTQAGLPSARWSALLRSRDGTMWLRSPSTIAWLRPGAGRFQVEPVPGGAGRYEADAGLLQLVEDGAQRIVTQSAHGLLVRSADHWTSYGHDQSLPYVAVNAMLVDREGSLWIGSLERGAARAVGLGRFENWTHEQGLADDLIWSVRRDGAGALWVADDAGVERLDERRPSHPAQLAAAAPSGHASPLLTGRSFSLARAGNGDLFVGKQSGALLRVDAVSDAVHLIARLPPVVTLLGSAGHLWIGTTGGLFRLDDSVVPAASGSAPVLAPKLAPELAPVLASDVPATGAGGAAVGRAAPVLELPGRVFSLALDPAGGVWALGERAVYRRLPTGRWLLVEPTDPKGGYQTRTMAFTADGSLWLGSFTDGITRLRLENGRVVARDHSASRHIAAQDVEMLLGDHGGRLWVGTDQGLDVSDGTHWRHLGLQDGLAAGDLDEGASFEDRDGSLWFGTVGGLSHLISTAGLFTPLRMHPLITRLAVEGEGVLTQRQLHGTPHLGWTGNPLVIDFTALDYRYGNSIHYRYRLSGADRDWVEAVAPEARYVNPPYGRMTFEVMAVDEHHRAAPAIARLTFDLEAPWWRTWRIWVAAVGGSAALLLLLWRAREHYLLSRREQLERLVAERTREIEQARQILFKQANYDSLTGLLNRPAILQRLEEAMRRATAERTPLGVVLLDLDHFKRINDSFGHLAGDAVLAETGRRLIASTRGSDFAGRYGGEELLLVLPGLREECFERVEALRRSIFEPAFEYDTVTLRVTCSMGVTWLLPGDEIMTVIQRADSALYAAKGEGRDRIVFRHRPPEAVLAAGVASERAGTVTAS